MCSITSATEMGSDLKNSPMLKRVLEGLQLKKSPSELNQELQAEILAMKIEDQSAREKSLDIKNFSDEDKKLILEIDAKHNQRLKEIISTYGWPGIRLVGIEGSLAMWLLVQHQDRDPEFQTQCLQLLKEAVEKQDAGYREYAYLLDRVKSNGNLLQVYGTQWTQKEGKIVLYPCEDPQNLNQRRFEAGLNTIEEYREVMQRAYHLSDTDISL